MMNTDDPSFADPEENNSDSIDDMELESQSEMDSKSSDGSTQLRDLKPSDLKTEVKYEGFCSVSSFMLSPNNEEQGSGS